jgi:hypothetical protein
MRYDHLFGGQKRKMMIFPSDRMLYAEKSPFLSLGEVGVDMAPVSEQQYGELKRWFGKKILLYVEVPGEPLGGHEMGVAEVKKAIKREVDGKTIYFTPIRVYARV